MRKDRSVTLAFARVGLGVFLALATGCDRTVLDVGPDLQTERPALIIHGVEETSQKLLIVNGVEIPYGPFDDEELVKAIEKAFKEGTVDLRMMPRAEAVRKFGKRGKNGVVVITLPSEEVDDGEGGG